MNTVLLEKHERERGMRGHGCHLFTEKLVFWTNKMWQWGLERKGIFQKRINRIWRITEFRDCKACSKDRFKMYSQEEIVEHLLQDIEYKRNFLGCYFWMNYISGVGLGWCSKIALNGYLAHFKIINSWG